MSFPDITLFVTALAISLITGLLYAYSCSVNPGLGKLEDKEYLLAMQSINKEILNPVFFATFMGSLVLLPVSAWLNYGQPRFWLLVAAAGLYAIGVFGVTMTSNVPLNEGLAAFDIGSATNDQITGQRLKFEQPWNSFHKIRTWASFGCLVMVMLACWNSSESV